MKSILRKQTVPRGILMAGVLFVTLFIGVSYASRAQADSLQPVSGQRLITLHDRGEDKSFLTRTTSVRKALQGAHIYIDPNDLVEPGLDDELVGSSYEVNIYRARPVTIVDGSTHLRVLSAYQTAKQIVEHAGMTLHDEDRTSMTQDADIVGGNAGVQLTIDRATAFTFNLYGKTVTAYTQAKTIAELLKEKGITLGPNDGLSLSQTTPITAGMTVQIWRNGKQTITEEQAIDFSIQQNKDADQPVGYKKIQTPGTPGKKLVTYEVNMQNGQEVSRTEIQSVITQQPAQQVEIVGIKMTNTFSGSFGEALVRLRGCEAGGSYSRNSGNGYYGAYQYNISTWGGYQGFQIPSDAPAAVQDERAWQTYQSRGWQPWPACSNSQGLQDIYR